MGLLTKNFSRDEFACKGEGCCGNSSPISLNLVEALQELRSTIDQPIIIVSGFRCRTHNRAVGGAVDSQHCLGTAADIVCPCIPPAKLAELAEAIPAFSAGVIRIYSA